MIGNWEDTYKQNKDCNIRYLVDTLYSTIDQIGTNSPYTSRPRQKRPQTQYHSKPSTSRRNNIDSVMILSKQLRFRQQNLCISKKTYTLDLQMCPNQPLNRGRKVRKGSMIQRPKQAVNNNVYVQGVPITCLMKARKYKRNKFNSIVSH